MTWNDQFIKLYQRSLKDYQDGKHDFSTHYSEEDLSFLAGIGYQARELFDFVEDLADRGEPTETTALLVASVRRDYFLHVQGGQVSQTVIAREDFPPAEEELAGTSYLPRIIAKAEAKLRGELDPDLMYSCGGDRRFLRENGEIHPADFLRHVWAAGGDSSKVLDYVLHSAS